MNILTDQTAKRHDTTQSAGGSQGTADDMTTEVARSA